MKKSVFTLLLIFLSLSVVTPKLWAQPTCVEANGLTWCYNDQACGQACEQVCAAIGIQLVVDDEVWFEAQNTEEECQAISQAFGLGDTVKAEGYTFACLEDQDGFHTVGGGLAAPLYCSTSFGCPAAHRTGMDQQGTPCGPGSRHSICPCGPRLRQSRPIPTLSEWGVIAIAGALGIIGIWAVRRRKLIA